MTSMDAAPRSDRPSVRAELLGGSLAVLASLAMACWILRDAITHLSATWGGGDSPANYMYAKALRDHAWITPNPDLGWPYGLDMGGYPVTEILPLLQLKVLALVSGNPVVAVNLMFLLSYPAAALTAYLLLRWLGISRLFAVLLAVGFSTVPWHLARFHHLFFATYASVAVALFLLSIVLASPAGQSWLRQRAYAWWGVVIASAVIVGLGGGYQVVFFLLILGTCLLARWLTHGFEADRARLAAVVVFVTGACFATSALLYRVLDSSPASAAIAERTPIESLLYGGDLSSLLMPSRLTWIADRLPERLTHTTGVIDSIGLTEGDGYASPLVVLCVIIALLVALGAALGRTRPSVDRLAPWPGILLATTFFFILGGGGFIFAQLLHPQIRAWGRLSIWIVLLAMVIVGLVLTHLTRRSAARPVLTAVLAGVLTLLVVDQSSQPPIVAANVDQQRELTSLGTFADALLRPGCPIFNQPSKEFPESGQVNDMIDYAHFYPYVYFEGHPMSYGSVKGTVGDLWQRVLPTEPADLSRELAAMGFCGVLVDTFILPADQRAPAVDSWTAALGKPIGTALDRWYLFGLPQAQGADVTSSQSRWNVVARPLNAGAPDFADGAVTWWASSAPLEVALVNVTDQQQSGVLELPLTAAPCLGSPITINGAGAAQPSVTVGASEQASLQFEVDLAPRASQTLELGVDGAACKVGGDPRDLLVQIGTSTFQPGPSGG